MKTIKLLAATLFILFTFNQGYSQQWTTSGLNIYNANSGNVGIGDNTPEKKLTVNGVQVIYGYQAALMLGGLTNTSSGWGEYGIEYNHGGFNFWKPYGNSYNGSTVNFILFLKDNGNVGIGTSNPTEKLTVNGTILAEKVRIISAVGADFVFDKDYNLPSLFEVEEFINKNNHLPDIPSANKMQEEGVDMSALQIKLLQKVEELTLYVIDLKKKTKELEDIIKNSN